MKRPILRAALLPCLCCCVVISGCKIVANDKAGEASVAADSSGDDVRIAALVEESFEQTLLPHVEASATDITVVRTAIEQDMKTAGDQYAHRASGEGAAWTFAIKGQGTVISSNRESRAASLQLDTDNDGVADMSLQLGPVFKGTALRDVAPFYNFSAFRDQIEFARLGRALNDKVYTRLALPDGDLVGRTVDFAGVFPARSANDKIVVTPVRIDVGS